MLSSRPLLSPSVSCLEDTQLEARCGLLSQQGTLHDCKLALQDLPLWLSLLETLTGASVYTISSRPRFPINHMTASIYFHRCVLFRESLIDGLVKGQYATLLILWNILNHIIVYKWLELDRNTWNHITVCKLFVLGIVAWS